MIQMKIVEALLSGPNKDKPINDAIRDITETGCTIKEIRYDFETCSAVIVYETR